MCKITQEQINAATQLAHTTQNKKYGHDCDSWEYELVFDREYGFVTMFVTFSTGDVEEVPVNYTVTKKANGN